MDKNQKQPLVYTLLGYVVLGVIIFAVGAVIVVVSLWTVNHHVSDESLVKWGGLTLNTAGLFGWVLKQSRGLRRTRVFIWTFLGLLFIHLVSFWLILSNVEHWTMAYFLFIVPLELPVIAIVLDWTTSTFGSSRKHIRSNKRKQAGSRS